MESASNELAKSKRPRKLPGAELRVVTVVYSIYVDIHCGARHPVKVNAAVGVYSPRNTRNRQTVAAPDATPLANVSWLFLVALEKMDWMDCICLLRSVRDTDEPIHTIHLDVVSRCGVNRGANAQCSMVMAILEFI